MRRTLFQIKAILEDALPSGEVAAVISRRVRAGVYFSLEESRQARIGSATIADLMPK